MLPGFAPAVRFCLMRLGERDYPLVRLEERIRCVEAKVPNNGRTLRDAPYKLTPRPVTLRWVGRKIGEGGLTRGACPEFCRRTQTKSAGS